MSGKTDFLIGAVLLISLVAVVTDLIRGRIFNWLTFPSLLGGLVFSLFYGGWSGLGDSILGATGGLLLYGWMFWLGVLGGGDVKFLMALGAWGGSRYVAEVALLGVILGGVMALGHILIKGKILDFSKRMYHFLLTVFIKELELEAPKVDRKLTMPFGIPIAIAAAWVVLAPPFERWGIRLWH